MSPKACHTQEHEKDFSQSKNAPPTTCSLQDDTPEYAYSNELALWGGGDLQ